MASWGSGSSDGSGSGSGFFALVDLVVFAFLDLVVLRPPVAFLFPLFVAVEVVDIVDLTDVVLVSIDSSRSGMSIILGGSMSDCVDMFDCVDNRVDTFDVLDAFEALPFFAFGLLDGAVVPAKAKNGHSGFRR
jgi:hypothetical protein